MAAKQFLSGVHAVILEQGLGRARAQILAKQLENHGGKAEKVLSRKTTHILIGKTTRLTRIPNLLKMNSIPENVLILRADWLSMCLVAAEKVGHDVYVVHAEPSPATSPSNDKASPARVSPSAVNTPPKKQLSPSHSLKQSTLNKFLTPPDEEAEERKTEESASKLPTTPTRPAASLTSPKAGMFPVVSRRWKVSPKKRTVWDNLDSDSDYEPSGDEEDKEEPAEEEGEGKGQEEEQAVTTGTDGSEDEKDGAIPPPAKRKMKWICEYASSEAQSVVNHNKHITDKLEELITIYKNHNEKWRAMSTTKVVQALRKHPTEIKTYEEARSLPFVGERLADKIYEIITSGHLRRLDNVDREKEKIIEMFKGIHGVGATTAQQFYTKGHRTLDDLRQSEELNRVQKIGLRHYDDFNERMQREEVEEIETKVRELAHSIDDGLEVVTCGSYRRGKPTCGDVDILVTHPDGRSHRGVFMQLLEKGNVEGFLTDDLSVHNDPEGQSKYLGVCRLGEGRKYRRLDIYVVPYSQFPLTLLHFTGSGHFNRSMRHKADKLGMSLSEYALCTGVIRKNGVKIFEGTPLPVTCEEDVFNYLDIPYREPKDRDWD